MIHDKIDHMIMHQQQELIEIQKVQIEMMNDILDQIKK
jgi:predicted AAA+ superfamily ATPase